MPIRPSSPDPTALPADMAEYPEWLRVKFGYNVRKGEVEYNANSALIHHSFSRSPFWEMVKQRLPDINERYFISTGYSLFSISPTTPELVLKSFNSFLEKTYRRNFVKPSAPAVVGEWFDPDRWYQEIDDIVRTFFVVKFLDGVQHLITAFSVIASECHLRHRHEWKSNDDGYYAAHLYISHTLDLPIKGEVARVTTWIELQITTQLQEILRTFLHKIYERARMQKPPVSDIPWQWRYQDDEFFTNYLGHVLHNIEGMIMQIRAKTESRNA